MKPGLLLLPLLCLLTSCGSVKNRLVPREAGVKTEGVALRSHTVVVDPTNPMFATGIPIKRNTAYLFTAVTALDAQGRGYADKHELTNPSSPDGPDGGLHPVFDSLARNRTSSDPADLRRLRVLKDQDGHKAHFLTLMGVVGRHDDARLDEKAFVIGSRRAWRSGTVSGMLHVFANDWPVGSMKASPYANNLGMLILTVTELPKTPPLQ